MAWRNCGRAWARTGSSSSFSSSSSASEKRDEDEDEEIDEERRAWKRLLTSTPGPRRAGVSSRREERCAPGRNRANQKAADHFHEDTTLPDDHRRRGPSSVFMEM